MKPKFCNLLVTPRGTVAIRAIRHSSFVRLLLSVGLAMGLSQALTALAANPPGKDVGHGQKGNSGRDGNDGDRDGDSSHESDMRRCGLDNGSFEFGLWGWNAVGSVGIVGPVVSGPVGTDGQRVADIGLYDSVGSALYQDLQVKPGGSYKLRFDSAAISSRAGMTSVVQIVVMEGSNVLTTRTVTDYSPAQIGGTNGFTERSLGFTVPAKIHSVRLGFLDQSPNGGVGVDALIDNVCVQVGIPTYPPTILQQPTNATAHVGENASFSVVAAGTAPLSYQWRFGGTNLVGQTGESLNLSNVQLVNAGNYSVLVTNPYGSILSSNALLTVLPLATNCTPAPAGLVSWWRSESNALDSVGSNNGVLVNGTGFAPGKVGTAFSLDGASQYVLVKGTPSLNVGLGAGLTFEGWIKPAATNTAMLLFEFERFLGSPNNSDVGIQLFLSLSPVGGAGPGSLNANLVDTNQTYHIFTSGAGLVTTGVWQHVALAYDKASGVAAIYLNGLVVAQTNLGTFTPQTSFTNLLIGARTAFGSAASPVARFAGGMDELSIYSRALSPAEILAIYNADAMGKCPPAGVAPTITQQPTNVTAHVGDNVSFGVVAAGTAPLSYQWRFGGTNLAGQTGTSLSLTNVQLVNAGNYSVLVTNAFGSILSSDAPLNVLPLATNCTLAPAGLVSWWRSESNALDSVGSNNGVLVNGTGFAPGKVGTAFSLDGASQYVLVKGTPSLNVGLGAGLTFEGWIKPAATSTPMVLFEFERFLGSPNNSDVGIQLFLSLSPVGGAGPGSLNANLVDTNQAYHIFTSGPGLVATGVWQHVALAYDKASGMAAIYLNGLVVAQTNLGTFTPQTSFTNLLIGARTAFASAASPVARFAGGMDELSIYSRALSPAEILAIYNADAMGKCPPAGVAPTITQQPTNVTAHVGDIVVFNVAAAGTAPLGYQWRFGGTNLAGQTGTFLSLSNVQLSSAGNYSVLVTNPYGSILSSNALLTVLPLATNCTPSPAGLVSWWRSESNALDSVGSNNGVLVNGTGFAPGKVGTAFSLDGASQYVRVNGTPSLNVGLGAGLTFEGWIKPAATSTPMVLFEFERFLGSPNNSDVGVQLFLSLSPVGGAGPGSLNANLVDTNQVSHIFTSGAGLVAAGAWQHVALAYDKASGVAAIYLNGLVVAQTNLGTFTPQTSFTNLLIGARTAFGSAASPVARFAGGIDELSVYGRALSPAEILAIYNADGVGKCPPAGVAPSITQQPTNVTAHVGDIVGFNVAAAGTAPLGYQWRFGGTNLAGQTGTFLILTNVQSANAGNYSVMVTNPFGSILSSNALLTVLPLTTNCTPAPAGLVSWWRAEGNANDSADGNNGMIVGTTGYVPGRVGQAFFFDGTNSAIVVPAATNLAGQSLTVEAWIQISPDMTLARPIVEFANPTGLSSMVLWYNVGPGITTSHGGLLGAFRGAGTTAVEVGTAPGVIITNQWNHVALTFEASNSVVTLYANGVSVGVKTSTVPIVWQSFENVNLGYRPVSSSELWGGRRHLGPLDEVSIYNRALSAAEIQAIYNADGAGKCPPAGVAPTITQQPTNVTAHVGDIVGFNVAAAGTAPLGYQWRFGGTNLAGQTGAALNLTNVQFSSAGSYSVLVTNSIGSALSSNALLVVLSNQPPCLPAPAGLVSWWQAESNALDAVGGNSGVLANGAGFGAGETGTAFSLNGANQYVLVNPHTNLNVGLGAGFTFEGWINPATINAQMPLFEFERFLGSSSGADLGPQLYISLPANTAAGSFFVNLTDTSGASHILRTGPGFVSAGAWQHVALSYDKDSGMAAVYLNGLTVTQANLGTFTMQTGFTNLVLGARTIFGSAASPPDRFSGKMDELSVYSRALSASEIQAIYSAGAAGKCPPTGAAPTIVVRSVGRGTSASENALLTGRLVAPVLTATGFRVNVIGQPGATYAVQRALTLSGPWVTVGQVTANDAGLGSYEDRNNPAGKAFYRTIPQ
jgi:hypothetical protein